MSLVLISSGAHGISSNLLVVALKGSKILAGLRELTLLHTLTNVPVNKGTLGVHQVELVVKTRPSLSDGSGVAEHADSTLDRSHLTTGDSSGCLVIDTNLETGGAPVNKLDGTLGLDGGNGRGNVIGDDITAVQQAARHVLTTTRITLDHLVAGLKASIGDLRDGHLLVLNLVSRDDWSISDQGEVDTRVRDQVGLELVQVNIEGTIKAKRGSN